ncbi:MAG: maleylpyruvate isomerase family protein, partial [Cellulomonadaceae bacterium]|nr:maleylpyruvate isomerase family protein [Cellulomonadaceae bacterium]
MGGRQSATDLVAIEGVLRAQWLRLRRWVGELDQFATQQPSVLGGWTVEDLVAHLGRAMDALAAAQPTTSGTVPLTLAEYLGTYPDRGDEITALTHELAVEIRPDPLGAVDHMAEAAFAKLGVLRDLGPDPVVQARRGPILLSEMIASRVLELVVHGDDLARSTHRVGPGPLEPAAVSLVASVLLEIVVDRGGWDLEVVDELAWIRLACGRVPLTVEALTGALRAT